MTYRKITSSDFTMSNYETKLFDNHFYWKTCKCSQLGCACCQAHLIKELFGRHFSRCYNCICCKDKFPFLKEILVSSRIKWQYAITHNGRTFYEEFARNDVYESIEDSNDILIVCDYVFPTKIPCSIEFYTEQEICKMAIKIVDKNGHTYVSRSEKCKVYHLMEKVKNMEKMEKMETMETIKKVSPSMRATFHIDPIVDIIASYMGLYLALDTDCLSLNDVVS